MTKEKVLVSTLSVLAVLGLLAAGIATTHAFGGWGRDSTTKQAIKQAIEDKDYQAFKNAISGTIPSEQQFNQIANQQQALKDAINTGDYQAWKSAQQAIEKTQSLSEQITQDNFADYVAIQKLIQDGKVDEAKTKIQEFSTKYDVNLGRGFGMRGGMHGAMKGFGM